MKTRRILFAGYAPVHFLCFRPVYERLRSDPAVDLWLSGGFRTRDETGTESYEIERFYEPFGVDEDRVISFDRARQEAWDVTICGHTSQGLVPPRPGKTVQIFHGVSFKNFAVRDKVLRYDVLCIPGNYHANRFREQNLFRNDGPQCLLTGFPKVDRLIHDEFDRSGLIRSEGLDPAKPTVLYAPTGGKHNSLETMGKDIVRAITADGRWNLLVKPHDHPKRKIDWTQRLAPFSSGATRVVCGLDVVDYLKAADLLLSDASSVAFEYTLLDRPIIFIDVPKLFKNVVKRGAPLDLETHGRSMGAVARTAEEVVAEIESGLAHPERRGEKRRATAADVFHRPGDATRRVAEAVRWAAGLRPDLPEGVEKLAP